MFGKTLLVWIGFVCSPFLATTLVSQAMAQQTFPTDAQIQKILADRIEYGESLGLVVGLIGPAGSEVISAGAWSQNDKRKPDGDTLFEIGSITKVFTATLLAAMVQDGEVSLSDPVSKYLPPDVKVPERNHRAITLEELAAHRPACRVCRPISARRTRPTRTRITQRNSCMRF
jgi:serine-type D-Ala-D-Ala carboxypeptidase/endopeptidase